MFEGFVIGTMLFLGGWFYVDGNADYTNFEAEYKSSGEKVCVVNGDRSHVNVQHANGSITSVKKTRLEFSKTVCIPE